tara:strand:- start:2170 stop:2775 length:606 start_codon:yes stop_codon:yes gene_type:complete
MSKKYIKINLNQVVSRFQMEEMILNRNRTYMAIAASFCFICLFSFMSYTNYELNKLIDSRENDIKALNQKINSLKKEGQVDLSKKDIEGLFKFESKRNYWTPKLQALADLTPKEMVIEELEFDKGKLNITAITRIEEGVKEFDVVERFMNTIKEDPNFKDSFQNIKFINSFRQTIQNQETFTFKIQAKLKKPSKKKRKGKK